MKSIPSAINEWEKSHVAEYYIDQLGWNLTLLKSRSKDPFFSGDKRYELDREELLTHLSNGANLGVFPAGDHVVLDLDSKQDNGKSVNKFLAQAGPKVQVLPREQTAGGVHIHLRIKDFAEVIHRFPGVGKLVNKKVTLNVVGELFFGGYSSVVASPSVHENGTVYQWEVTGEIPEWSWQQFETAFGNFVPDKTKKPDQEKRARKWAGDLSTLDIVALVQELGWYHGQDVKRPEMHHIDCPWACNHTSGKSLACVFVQTGSWPGFNCFHAHCSEHRIVDFLEQAEKNHPGIVDQFCTAKWKYEGKGSNDGNGRVRIILPSLGEQENDDFVEEVAEVLKDKEYWFTHGPDVIRIAEETKTRITQDGEVEACERVQLRQVTPVIVESTLGKHIATGLLKPVENEDGTKSKIFLKQSICSAKANMLINSPGLQDALPKIERLLDIPLPIPTGKNKWQLPTRGYNKDLRIVVDQDFKLREMPLSEALCLLEGITADFPFVDDDNGQSKCHWYARLITPMCRAIMGWDARMPAWMFVANRPRAGKDYLNGVAQILYYGYAFEDPAIAPQNSEETEKRIATALAAGRRSMHNANQQGHLADPAWIAAITSTVHTTRRMRHNDASGHVEYANELEFSMSANVGLTWRPDVPDRSRFIRLAYSTEDANSRTFSRPDLHGYVSQNRELLLSAIYSLLMYWKRKGCPPGEVFTSFPTWGEVVGGILQVCGLGNPCLPTNWGGMSIGGDLLDEGMQSLFVGRIHSRYDPRESPAQTHRRWVRDSTTLRELWLNNRYDGNPCYRKGDPRSGDSHSDHVRIIFRN